jgi:hypothetical protein
MKSVMSKYLVLKLWWNVRIQIFITSGEVQVLITGIVLCRNVWWACGRSQAETCSSAVDDWRSVPLFIMYFVSFVIRDCKTVHGIM